MAHTLLYSFLRADAQVPTRGSARAAGLDLYSCGTVVIAPGGRAKVPTGLAVQLPAGTYGRIVERSGVAYNLGIIVGAGVIDPDYSGEVQVVAFNLSPEERTLKPGTRIAQMIVEEWRMVNLHSADGRPDEPVRILRERGARGFGSSGLTEQVAEQSSYDEFWGGMTDSQAIFASSEFEEDAAAAAATTAAASQQQSSQTESEEVVPTQ